MIINIAAALLSAALQAQAPAPAAQTTTEKPAFERAPDALERVTWRTRTLVGDDRLTKWKLAIPGGGLTFLEAIVRADAAVVDFVEGSNTQRVSPQLPKMLDPNLTTEEIAAIRGRMGPVRILTYRVDRLDAAPASRRKVFEFAKAIGVDTIVVPSDTPLAGLDGLADEFGVNVAVLADSTRPVRLMK